MIPKLKVPIAMTGPLLLALLVGPGPAYAQAKLCGGVGCGSAACDGKQPGAKCTTNLGTGFCSDQGACASNPVLEFCSCNVPPSGPAARCEQTCGQFCAADYAQCSEGCHQLASCEHQCLAAKTDCDSSCVVSCLSEDN